ncbi:hypothetical protein V7974_004665 [Vibrio parahaemolyticus]
MLKTSSPLHPLNRKTPKAKQSETKPNPQVVATRRRIEELHEQRQLEQDFSL